MRNILALYRKEMAQYFSSPIAYVVGAIFLLVTGVVFRLLLVNTIEQSMQMSMQAMQFGGPTDFDVTGTVIRGFIGFTGTVTLFILPMLTMGLYTDERRRGTMELLMTSPLTDAQIVIGKFLASFSFYVLLLFPTVAYMGILFLTSEPAAPWRLMGCGYLGLVLLGAALIAIGSFLSSLTENQIIAAVGTFGVLLLLWLMDAAAGRGTGLMSKVLESLSILRNLDNFTRGVLDTSNLVFFLSMTIFGLFLTMRAVDAMRWRKA